jgi:antitoxin component YwqK of YwqJK toxin-antitoxin module
MSKNIKSETIYRVHHLPGEEIDFEQELEDKQSYREFDESGRLLLEIAYTQDGDVADKVEHRYDKAGRLMETLVYGEDDEVLERKELVWSDHDKVIREFTHYLDGSADTHDYFYDDSGNITGIEVKDDEGEMEFSERFVYEEDKVIKVERRNGEDELTFSQEDTYVNGVITTRKIWSSEETEPFTMIYQFNAAGHREQESRYNSRDQLIERNIFEEDEQGRVVLLVEENRQRKNSTEFSYDEKGNVIRQSEYDLNGDLNHEIFRIYNEDGDPLHTTVESVIKTTGERVAYSLVFRREEF